MGALEQQRCEDLAHRENLLGNGGAALGFVALSIACLVVARRRGLSARTLAARAVGAVLGEALGLQACWWLADVYVRWAYADRLNEWFTGTAEGLLATVAGAVLGPALGIGVAERLAGQRPPRARLLWLAVAGAAPTVVLTGVLSAWPVLAQHTCNGEMPARSERLLADAAMALAAVAIAATATAASALAPAGPAPAVARQPQ